METGKRSREDVEHVCGRMWWVHVGAGRMWWVHVGHSHGVGGDSGTCPSDGIAVGWGVYGNTAMG